MTNLKRFYSEFGSFARQGRKPARFIAAFTIAVLGAMPIVAAQTSNQLAKKSLNGYFQPGYGTFAFRTNEMKASMAALCTNPGIDTLQYARKSFSQSVLAWSHIGLVRFGPVTARNRLERILFWPDRRSIGLRQVQRILATKNVTATQTKTLHEKSVAVQGLTALEFVLFGTGSKVLQNSGADSFRCTFGNAIAGNIHHIAVELDAEWRTPNGIAQRLTSPQADDPEFRTHRDVVNKLVGTLAHGLEALKDIQLNPVLGSSKEKAREKRALFWRSQMALKSVRAGFSGLRALYTASGIGADLAEEHRWIDEALLFDFANVDKALASINPPVSTALGDDELYEKLRYISVVSLTLRNLVAQDLAIALGLSIGFSSLDGD